MAYATALFVNLVDNMGPQFTVPVLIPYGQYIGADLNMIALFGTVRGLAAVVSSIWMPRLSDRVGRKWVAFLSVAGCSLGYFIQGLACNFRDAEADQQTLLPSMVFMLGRFIAGFFCGMMPVLQAYITELSRPDMQLLTQRMVVTQVTAQVAGIALMPISGALATFGLQLPFFVCAGSGVCCMFFIIVFFKEAWQIKGQPPPQPSPPPAPEPADAVPDAKDAPLLESPEVESASFRLREAREVNRSPWCDLVIWLMFFAYLTRIVLVVGGSVFLMPLMFKQPSFGIEGLPDQEAFQGNIAKAVGLAGVPLGLLQAVTAIFLFVPVTNRVGERPVIAVCGAIVALLFPLYGFWADRIWKVAVLNAVQGLCFGFMSPALGPMGARYSNALFPKQMAMAQGIPIAGLQLSTAFSQNMMALVVGDGDSADDLTKGWCLLAVFCVAFVVIFYVTHRVVELRSLKPKLTVDMEKVVLQTGGQDVEEFIERLGENLKESLRKRRAELWNGEVQFLCEKRVAAAIPQIRAWNDDTQGREHLEDLGNLIAGYPERAARFQSNFPDACKPALTPIMDADYSVNFRGPSLYGNASVTAPIGPPALRRAITAPSHAHGS